jgi:hypothetical protein
MALKIESVVPRNSVSTVTSDLKEQENTSCDLLEQIYSLPKEATNPSTMSTVIKRVDPLLGLDVKSYQVTTRTATAYYSKRVATFYLNLQAWHTTPDHLN